MGRAENANVFKDTVHLMKQDPVLVYASQYSKDNQLIILENDLCGVPLNKSVFSEDAKIVVSGKRSFEAASNYKDRKVCVHNFASATTPGGGVVQGSSAQEEALCRVSTLYSGLNSKGAWEKFYYPHRALKNPLNNDDIIYTPDVCVFKTDTDFPKTMKKSDWYYVDVLTCAAPNLRANPSNRYNVGNGDEQAVISDDELYDLHVKRLSRICDVAISQGAEVLILGAFGCGAFCNSPWVVARASADVMEKYKKAFKVVEFAVYCSSKDQRNYEVFARQLKK